MSIIKFISALGLMVSLVLFTGCSGDDQQAEEAVASDAGSEEPAKSAAAAKDVDQAEESEAPLDMAEDESAPAPAPAPAPVPAPVVAAPPAPSVQPAPIAAGPQLGYNIGNFLLVKVDRANVRSGPGLEHPSIAKLKHGEKVTVAERRGAWVRIGEGQWVAQAVVTAYQKTFAVKVGTAEVRSAPHHKASILTKLSKGAQVKVQGMVGKWAKIGNKQFVLRAQLEQSK